MEILTFDEGGRPLVNDDFEVFQSEAYYAIFSQYLALPPCVVAGCAVRALSGGQYEVGAGLVFIEAGLYRFDGASAVTLPLELRLGAAVATDARPYESGVSKACMSERKLYHQAVSPATGARLLVTVDGALSADKAREGLVREVGEVGLFTIFPGQYDAAGKGRYGTKAYGWQLLNGQNSQPDAAARALVGWGGGGSLAGAAPALADFAALKATGGAADVTLGVPNLPPHAHEMSPAGEHSHYFESNGNRGPGGAGREPYSAGQTGGPNAQRITTSAASNHQHTIQNTGGGEPFSVRNPYLVLGARVWVGLT